MEHYKIDLKQDSNQFDLSFMDKTVSLDVKIEEQFLRTLVADIKQFKFKGDTLYFATDWHAIQIDSYLRYAHNKFAIHIVKGYMKIHRYKNTKPMWYLNMRYLVPVFMYGFINIFITESNQKIREYLESRKKKNSIQ